MSTPGPRPETRREGVDARVEERHRHLGLIAASPTIWVGHFLACYLTAAVWCAKAGSPSGDPLLGLGPVRFAIAVYTILALIGIVLVGRHGLRRHRFGWGVVPHDFDTSADRHRFLGYVAVLLSSLSFVGVLFVAMPGAFFGSCS